MSLLTEGEIVQKPNIADCVYQSMLGHVDSQPVTAVGERNEGRRRRYTKLLRRIIKFLH